MAHRTNNMTVSAVIEWTVYVLMCCWIVIPATAQDMKICTANSKMHPQGICGSHIDEVLKAFCGKGGFVSKHNNKRSAQNKLPSIPSQSDNLLVDMSAKDAYDLYKQNKIAPVEDLDIEPSIDGKLDDLLVKRADATSFLDKRISFYLSGVSCECCYHSCTVPEIIAYCKRPVRFGRRF